MPDIPFTQYILPHGRREETAIERPAEIVEKADRLIERGCHFDIEVLRNGSVSMTCERGDWVLAIKICENGPAVETSVDALVNEAIESLAKGEPKEEEE